MGNFVSINDIPDHVYLELFIMHILRGFVADKLLVKFIS